MNSFAHYSFGAVCEWMFASLAGIDTDGAGFRKIVIRPGVAEKGMDWVKAEYGSPAGKIVSQWKRENGRFELDVRVPANVTATVYVPGKRVEDVMESGRPVREVKDVQVVGVEGDRVVVKVGGGRYRFEAK
ncbi:MAG TPA: alpha-L-rhamnosidase C-terminal domain-containing protein [Tepidisphaeraceae bacterium]|nr:alpha-L-rhamnosidase C-terminal domain-containing protein [Tepidisphaeraceae bacterium]